jgi:uncharacterized protein YndB with AHSA1/START domain
LATLVRSRVVAAPPEVVWEVIADAYTLPRWWPRVTRVEGVEETGFTEVLVSRRGRPVRLDLHYTEVEPPERLSWALELSGSQLERLLAEWATRMDLAAVDGGTLVTLEERQSFRGSFRTGSLLQRRASRRRLDGALAGLAELF